MNSTSPYSQLHKDDYTNVLGPYAKPLSSKIDFIIAALPMNYQQQIICFEAAIHARTQGYSTKAIIQQINCVLHAADKKRDHRFECPSILGPKLSGKKLNGAIIRNVIEALELIDNLHEGDLNDIQQAYEQVKNAGRSFFNLLTPFKDRIAETLQKKATQTVIPRKAL